MFCNFLRLFNTCCNTLTFYCVCYVTLIFHGTYYSILICSNTCSSTIFQYYKQFIYFHQCTLNQYNIQYIYFIVNYCLRSFSFFLLRLLPFVYMRNNFSVLLIDITREINCCEFSKSSLLFFKKVIASKPITGLFLIYLQ